ncbi:GNAT family N-acetyltransferase [Desertivirga arenae]|uniref:GNAT family N-acetyltransferase n=1 Tax=Desertivirga arenae TaxID=2810309 RepID=UPI001A966FB7|nr:GNAT family N-acetyltransferase [Pedobacter sp. SYSU D00823]
MDYQQLREDLDWWMVYYYSFAPEERESELVILKSVASETGMAFSAKDGNVTKGIATVHLLKDISTIFLVYLAIVPSERGKGIGTEFFRFVEESATQKLEALGLKSAGMVWEVQKAGHSIDSLGSASDTRRAFFERNGGTVLPCRYIQPPVDGKNLIDMHLMVKSQDGISLSPTTLIKAVYYDKYHRVNEINKKTLDNLLGTLKKNE